MQPSQVLLFRKWFITQRISDDSFSSSARHLELEAFKVKRVNWARSSSDEIINENGLFLSAS
jgi:hypothetical protein